MYLCIFFTNRLAIPKSPENTDSGMVMASTAVSAGEISKPFKCVRSGPTVIGMLRGAAKFKWLIMSSHEM